MNWFIYALFRSLNFTGRATRREFFWFVIFAPLVTFGFIYLDNQSGVFYYHEYFQYFPHQRLGQYMIVWLPILLISSLSLIIRRLHDHDFMFLWIVLFFIPAYGQILFVYMMTLDGDWELNRFGPNPRPAPKKVPLAPEDEAAVIASRQKHRMQKMTEN